MYLHTDTHIIDGSKDVIELADPRVPMAEHMSDSQHTQLTERRRGCESPEIRVQRQDQGLVLRSDLTPVTSRACVRA